MTEWVCDYAWGGPPAGEIAGKYVAVIRYASSTDPNKPRGKDLTEAELKRLHAAGVGVGSVWETTVTEARGGWQAGVRAGRLHNARLDVLGFPRSTAAYYAVDEEPPDLAAVVAYFAGAAAQGRMAAPYGGFQTIEAACGSGKPNVAPKGWQTVAWSRGRLSPRAALLQLVARPVPGVSGTHDDNRVIDLAAVAAWFPGSQPPPPPPPSEDDMFSDNDRSLLTNIGATLDRVERRSLRQVTDPNGVVYLTDGETRVWVPDEQHRLNMADAFKLGAPEKWARSDIDAIPLVGPEAPGVAASPVG